jgi:hypothetical protein
MFRRSFIAFATLSIFAMPAFAATEFWVARNASTNKCEVVAKKPDGKMLVEIGKAGYRTKQQAEKAMKASADCK